MIADINRQVVLPEDPYPNENRSELRVYTQRRIGGKKEWVEIEDRVVKVGATLMFVCKFIDMTNTERTDIKPNWSISGLERYKTDSHGVIEENMEGPIIEGQSYTAYDAKGMTLTFKLNRDYYLGGTRFTVSVSDPTGDYASAMELEVEG